MLQPQRKAKKWIWGVIGFLALGTLGIALSGFGPDFEFTSTKRVIAFHEKETLAAKWMYYSRWVSWFHKLEKVEVLADDPVPHVELGQQIKLTMASKRFFHPFVDVQFRVASFDSDRKLGLTFISDSTGRLEKLFSKLEWELELQPESNRRTWVEAKIKAKTNSWKARIYARLVPRILLNQVFYPNLIAFAERPHLYEVRDVLYPDLPR
jgi:hypothetical protein